MKTIDPKILGSRLKFFRERAHISQFDLEGQMDAASGMISRIESGKVNPSKETVKTMAQKLGLNILELDYLIGTRAEPATEEEILLAKNSVKDYFEKDNVFAYLSDDRWRLFYFSKGFRKIIEKLLPENIDLQNDVEGRSIIQVLINPDLGVRQIIDSEYYEKLMLSQLTKFYAMVSFMQDDEYYQEGLKWIMSDPITGKLWTKYIKSENNLPNIESRTIPIQIKSLKISMNYFKEELYAHPRFVMVEYKPANKALKFVAKLLG